MIVKNIILLEEQFRRAEKYYDQLSEEYDSTQVRLNDSILNFYDMLDEVSLREANIGLNNSQLREFKRDLRYYLTDDVDSRWKTHLEGLQNRVRVPRLEKLMVDIEHELERLTYLEEQYLRKLSEEVYSDVYYKELYQTVIILGYSKIFDGIDKKKFENIVKQGWADDKLNFSERIRIRNDKITNHLEKYLIRSIKVSEEPMRMISETKKKLTSGNNQAGRLIMTETSYYTSKAEELSYKEIDIEKYQIVATLDDRTSEICQMLDMEIFEMSEFEVGVTAPPFHPYCRTVTSPYFDDNYTTRIARDTNDGWYEVEGNISYAEWRDKYVR